MKVTRTSLKALPLMAVGALLAFTLAGCSNASGDTQKYQERIDSLEQRIDALEKKIEGKDKDAGKTDANANGNAQNQGASSMVTAATYDEIVTQLSEVEIEVEEAKAAAEVAVVPANENDRISAYYEASSPLESLDQELDDIEDQIEAAYKQNIITRDEERELKRAKDQIERTLDETRDSLELLFGIDD